MTTTALPTRCHLRDVADHRFVTVEARILAVEIKHADTRFPWAVVTLVEDGDLLEVRAYPTTFALASEHLQVGNRVVVSAEVATDADGTFAAAHTVAAS